MCWTFLERLDKDDIAMASDQESDAKQRLEAADAILANVDPLLYEVGR